MTHKGTNKTVFIRLGARFAEFSSPELLADCSKLFSSITILFKIVAELALTSLAQLAVCST